jgi:transcriptional regulator with XRE-family HTH domain
MSAPPKTEAFWPRVLRVLRARGLARRPLVRLRLPRRAPRPCVNAGTRTTRGARLELFPARRRPLLPHLLHVRPRRRADGGSYYFLDLTALGRQEDWEEPKGRAAGAHRPRLLGLNRARGPAAERGSSLSEDVRGERRTSEGAARGARRPAPCAAAGGRPLLRELAERTKVSNAYLSQLERGLHEPSFSVLRAVASALGVPLGRGRPSRDRGHGATGGQAGHEHARPPAQGCWNWFEPQHQAVTYPDLFAAVAASPDGPTAAAPSCMSSWRSRGSDTPGPAGCPAARSPTPADPTQPRRSVASSQRRPPARHLADEL